MIRYKIDKKLFIKFESELKSFFNSVEYYQDNVIILIKQNMRKNNIDILLFFNSNKINFNIINK